MLLKGRKISNRRDLIVSRAIGEKKKVKKILFELMVASLQWQEKKNSFKHRWFAFY